MRGVLMNDWDLEDWRLAEPPDDDWDDDRYEEDYPDDDER